MQISEYREKTPIKRVVNNPKSSDDRGARNTFQDPDEPPTKKSSCSKKKIFIGIIVGVIIAAGIITAVVLALKNEDEPPESPGQTEVRLPEDIDPAVVKDICSSSFKVSSKEDTLTQISQKLIQSYQSTNDGQTSSYTILTNLIIDMFTINSTTASGFEKNLFSNKYMTAITVNSLCSKISSNPDNDECQLAKVLDLNKREDSNLRREEEVNEDLLRRAILPICIVEHTDSNLVISMTCPETLSENYKSDILRAFYNIKPNSMKGFEFDKNYADTKVEEREDKIYINSFDNVCSENDYDPTKTITCHSSKDIITDKEGILISSKIINSTETIIDEKNSFSNSLTYEFKNIPKDDSESFNEDIYRKNLDSILSITKSLMKKESYINNFTDFVIDLMANNSEANDETNLRYLREQEKVEERGVHEENIFTKTIANISMDLNLKNDIGLSAGQAAKAISTHNVNNENYKELSINKIETNLNKTLEDCISLGKSGDKLGAELYENLNEPLLNFMDLITENIEKVNSFLVNKDLSQIFDSTLAIKELDSLPYDFITATENLYITMNNFKENILYTIDSAKKKLKEDISGFLTESHNLMFQIFDNLRDLSNTLSSDKSKIVAISTYYLNNTESSYYEIIQKAKNILDNYYKEEKNLIYPLVNTQIEKFYKKAVESFQKYQTMIDDISERLNDGNLIITLANTIDYQKAVENIYNTKIKVNEIIDTVKSKFEECINPYSNGYFESEKEIEENNKSHSSTGDNALKISYALDNNEFVDKTFDNVMASFRDKFIELLKNMENSVKDKFYLEENVLGTTLFDTTYLNEIDDYFKQEKINILNDIKNQNNEYLKSVNEILTSFKNDNGKSLDQIMSELITEMTDLYFDNLNTAYKESLDLAFQKIDEIIDNNNNLGTQYLTEVKNANSFHITNGFKNKYNAFASSIQTIYDYINKNLKINLANKYKNAITQVRANLQTIKSNTILEKYYKQLPSAENHLNTINDLFEIFNRHISDSNYNMKFLPLINNYIKGTNDKLNKIKQNFQDIYNEMAKKGSDKKTNDWDKKRTESYRYCRKRFLGICIRHSTATNIYYDGYNVKSTNNHLNLVVSINFEEYMKEFDNKFNELYPKFSQNILSYNNLLSELDIKIENESKKDTFKGKIADLDNISEKIKTIIEEKLGNNILSASYNYFKNKVDNTLPGELTTIIEQWKAAYDQIYNDLDSNKNDFKSTFLDFYYIGSFYIQAYYQNISYSYGESIVEKLKNDFNYTNKYYYNIIISKLNKTYSYILNNLPVNEKPFDKILNTRISEINESFLNSLNELKNSQNEILEKDHQEVTLQVNGKNFFKINDIIQEHIKLINETITEKNVKLQTIAVLNYKQSPKELIAGKFFFENSINGKQIKYIYDMINKDTFIDLQTHVYQNLIDDTWKVDRDELIKNIMNILKKFNETNNNNFKYEKEKYIELLKNKLYGEFYTKEDLIAKINLFFLNGINSCKDESKEQINALLDSVLNKVITHITNEASRLDNELTSYSNSFTDIKSRLNNYKTEIYEQFYSVITYVVNEFHEQILEKFYKNFIEVGITQYESYVEEKDFGTATFLNMTINLNEVINKEFKLLINDYKNLAYNQIKFLYEKNIQSLEQLFDVTSLKLKINNEIDNAYNSKLLPILQKVATHNPGDDGVSNYDLPESILQDINDFIKDKISNAKDIMKNMEGKEFIISDIAPADFSAGKDNVYDEISKQFTNFTLSYSSKERKEFNEIVGQNAINNFKSLMNNFIPSFGADFFDRILKYNEIQKIHMLYYNLKYSLAGTILYYVGLAILNKGVYLPIDIKLKLYSLNDLDTVVKSKNDYILSTLNDKLDKYFEETKNYIVNKYIDDMKTNEEFNLKFNSNLKDIIIGLISGNIHYYENEYINMIKAYIIEPFISEYKKVLNEATDDMKHCVEDTKVDMKANLEVVFSTDSDTVLSDIQTKSNNTKNAIEKYNEHFVFKISEDVVDFLDSFGEKLIAPKYNQIKDLLDKKTAELVINNLEKLSNEFREEYSVETFENKIKQIDKNLTSSANKFINILKKYGSIKDNYKENLEKEISNYRRIRRLEDAEGEGNNKISEIKIDKAFDELKKSSSLVKDFIQSLILFSEFEDNIKKYINQKNEEYSLAEYILEKNKNKNENYDLMIERLKELNTLSLDYYTQIQNNYEKMKEEIINNIIQISEMINTCEKNTFEIIADKYNEIKDKFNKIEEEKNSEVKEINIPPYNTHTDEYFTVETNIKNYLIDNKFSLDIVFDDETKTFKIKGTVINNINPKNFDINFYSSIGNEKLGRRINVAFNKISSYSNITFNADLNQANIITNFYYSDYTVNTQYYEEKDEPTTIIIMGMTITIPGSPVPHDIETPEEEKVKTIDSKNVTFVENYIY